MLILLRLDPRDEQALKAYRLQVKERIYRFNFVSPHLSHSPYTTNFKPKKKEMLIQLDKKERLEKLEETFQAVCDDYARILGLLRQ
jgi:histone acetyltransferase 1